MRAVTDILRSWYRALRNARLYQNQRSKIKEVLKKRGYSAIRPFQKSKWHHQLYLFTAVNSKGEEVFVKLTRLGRILKNENKAYRRLIRHPFLSQHIIERKEYFSEGGYRVLVLKKIEGNILTVDWMVSHISELGTLIRIVDAFAELSLVHRDIKPDNFILEGDQIKVFDFSFMIDLGSSRHPREIRLSLTENLEKLIALGSGFKPAPLEWDDYYALSIIFNNLLKGFDLILSASDKTLLNKYLDECRNKLGTKRYTILK